MSTRGLRRRVNSLWLASVVTTALVLGVAFRLVNLDRKFYSHDEAYTSLRSSGYTRAEVITHLFDGHDVRTSDLQRYQRPNREKGVIDTVMGLAHEEPQMTPFYFLLARGWMDLWMRMSHNSVAVMRSLAALLGLLVIPTFGWLSWELFKSRPTAWIGVALMSVSPLQVLYSQDARPYTLWTLTILGSSVALLRAMRSNTARSWVLYSIAAALGLYSHLLFTLVAIAHALYVLVLQKFRATKVLAAYACALGLALLAFAPWALVMVIHFHQALTDTAWTRTSVGLSGLVQFWMLNFTSPLVDVDLDSSGMATLLIRLAALALIAGSFRLVWRASPRRVSFFVTTLMVVPVAPLLVPDLLWGGMRSTTPRFLIPGSLGTQLVVAHALARWTDPGGASGRVLWRAGTSLVILGGILSCTMSLGAETWWDKWLGLATPEVARRINQAGHPLVIVDEPHRTNLGDLLALSHYLDARVRLRLGPRPSIIPSSLDVTDVFLFNPSDSLRAEIEQSGRYGLEPAVPRLCLPPNTPWPEGFRCLGPVVLWRLVTRPGQPG